MAQVTANVAIHKYQGTVAARVSVRAACAAKCKLVTGEDKG